MDPVIRTEQLTKAYGSHRGIIDVDLTIQPAEAFGFLGPNGAGKTTTIRTLLDHIRPTSGRAFVFGIETTVDPVAIHRRVGYLPGEFTLYEDDGISLEYLEGQGVWTRMTWDDGQRRLTIEPGAPAGAAAAESTRTFRVELLPSGETTSVEYAGDRVEVTL